MKLVISLVTLFFLSISSNAAVDNSIIVHGVLKSFNAKYAQVEVKNKDGDKPHLVRVPRENLGEARGYVIGTAVVTVQVPLHTFAKLNFQKSK